MAAVSLTLATAVWLPVQRFIFRPDAEAFRHAGGVGADGLAVIERHLALWRDPVLREAEVARMRRSNAEWDFMGRTFLVLALANLTEREPARRDECLRVIDAVIDETLALEVERGQLHFLMDYARFRPFVHPSGRSVFVDGEIAMMLAVRQLVADEPRFRGPLRERVAAIVEQMGDSRVGCAESYPDECWMFCNALAAAAVRVSDAATGEDHSAFFDAWLRTVRRELVDVETGLLVSSFTLDGRAIDGPEGSSIFMAAHCLQLLDARFAEEQYALAKRHLARRVLGFGYAVEWPTSWQGPVDIDSGPIVPIVGASAGSSGMAILGAAAFGDDAYLSELLTSLNFAGFPVRDGDRLRYAASNQVGDAVLAYAMVEGPVWRRVQETIEARQREEPTR